jgi:hypothetical protein
VGVDAFDPVAGERGDDVGVERGRERLAAAGATLDDPAVGDLGRVEQRVPGGDGLAQGAVPASARAAASS